MAVIFLNGEIVDETTARIAPDDRGLLYGDGLFESMRAYGGKVFRLDAHLARLAASAEFLRIRRTWDNEAVRAAIAELIRRNACPEAYVRVTLTRGAGAAGLRLDGEQTPTLTIAAKQFHPFPPEQYRAGARLIVSRYRLNCASPMSRHKTLNCLPNLLARQEATDAGANGAILLNEYGQAACETFGNLFIVEGGRLLTPPVHCGALPGITRATVMQLAAAAGIPCEERAIPGGMLFECEEIFLTSSLMGIMPVRSVDRRAAGNAPGPITRRLSDAYAALVAREYG